VSSSIKRLINKGNVDSILSYIKGWEKGDVELSKEDIRTLLNYRNSELRFITIRALFQRYPFARAKELLRDTIGVTPLTRPVNFSFPAVNKSEKKFVEAIAFKSDKPFYPEDLNVRVIKEFVGSEFSFVFDRKFVGDSFQAPLVYALLYGELPQNVVISGKLLPSGSFWADLREEKEELCNQSGKILIAEGNIHEINRFFSKKNYSLPFFIATGNLEENRETFYSFSELQNLDTLKNFLDENLLIFSLPKFLPYDESWLGFFRKLRDKVLFLRSFLKNFSLHIALKVPITFSIGAGAVLGTGKLPVVIYHYENGTYHRVLDLVTDSRKIKRRRQELSLVKIEESIQKKNSGKAVIALQVASHETKTKGLEISETLEADFFYIYTPDFKGSLPLSLDWAEVVSEIYEAINRVYDGGYGELHLLMSVPNPIAYALGMAVGNYWNITIWSYFKPLKDYKPVYNLGEVENI
jgi:hypothetical protein